MLKNTYLLFGHLCNCIIATAMEVSMFNCLNWQIFLADYKPLDLLDEKIITYALRYVDG
jgi:hypothetical protein